MIVNDAHTAATTNRTRASMAPLASAAGSRGDRKRAAREAGERWTAPRILTAAHVRAGVTRPGAGPARARVRGLDGEPGARGGRVTRHVRGDVHARHAGAVAFEVGRVVVEVRLLGGRGGARGLHHPGVQGPAFAARQLRDGD